MDSEGDDTPAAAAFLANGMVAQHSCVYTKEVNAKPCSFIEGTKIVDTDDLVQSSTNSSATGQRILSLTLTLLIL